MRYRMAVLLLLSLWVLVSAYAVSAGVQAIRVLAVPPAPATADEPDPVREEGT